MTTEQLAILQHSLGCDQYGQSRAKGVDERDGCHGYYRNRYVANLNADLIGLAKRGLMKDHGAQKGMSGMNLFTVTEKGVSSMLKASPKAPKLSAGQKRYRSWLASDGGLTFKEWLGTRWAKEVV